MAKMFKLLMMFIILLAMTMLSSPIVAAATPKKAATPVVTSQSVFKDAINVVIKGDKNKLLTMLNTKKININTQDTQGKTLLYYAAVNRRIDIVNLLLTRSANPNIPDKYQWTPLMSACKNGDLEIARSLLKYKAKTNVLSSACSVESNGALWSPLMWASKIGSKDIILLLLQNKAKVDYIDQFGASALNLAAYYGNKPCVELLLKYGAPPDQGLGDACSQLHADIVSLLLDTGANPNKLDHIGMTALDWTVGISPEENKIDKQVKLNITKLLIEHGADTNLPSLEGDTPLKEAITSLSPGEEPEIVQYLIDKGADITTADKEGITPLMWACAYGNLKVCEMLIDLGADVNQTDIEGRTSLMFACDECDECDEHPEITRLLLAKDARPNQQAIDGTTALMMACKKGQIESIKLLMAANANPEIKDKNKKDSFDYAKEGLKSAQILLLLKSD